MMLLCMIGIMHDISDVCTTPTSLG